MHEKTVFDIHRKYVKIYIMGMPGPSIDFAESLADFSGVLMCVRKDSMPAYEDVYREVWKREKVSWLIDAPHFLQFRLQAFPDLSKRMENPENPALLLIEATECRRPKGVVDGISVIRKSIEAVLPSVIVTPGKSYATRMVGEQKVPYPEGYDDLLKEVEGFHVIESTGKSPFEILAESIRHHASHLLHV